MGLNIVGINVFYSTFTDVFFYFCNVFYVLSDLKIFLTFLHLWRARTRSKNKPTESTSKPRMIDVRSSCTGKRWTFLHRESC